MARKMQIVLNRDEISKQILRGKGTEEFLMEIGNRVADQSGLVCNVASFEGSKRLNVSVSVEPGTEDYYRNLHTNALASALY